ncbi:cytosolic sulfotransferase 15-like [Senna tora]|uniref:Cytosolic sulfotransferase 15-like n=1 Tax=Senna tora TaxID=362788 RepID=A0A834X0K3_9FABA|nr:cytosolic sulfotransferase 15-like [Senna tora]
MAETTMTKLTEITESNGNWEEKEVACEEENLSPKGNFHQELLHSLPREKGWGIRYLYFFQQFWCHSPLLKPIISFQKHFQAKHSDIVIASLPKSGTTWLKALAFATVRRKRFIPSQNDHSLLHSNPHTLVPFFEFIYGDNPNNVIPDLSTLLEPRLFSTHIPFPSLTQSIHNSNCKIIYICRNQFDTFTSQWHFANNIMSSESLPTLTLEEAFEKYSEGIVASGPFWSHLLGYWKASQGKSNKVLFLKYEDLKTNTKFELKRMAQFLDCPFSEEEESSGVIDSIVELCSFKKMKELDVNKSGKSFEIVENKHFFRKGEVGDWVNYFTPYMTKKLSKVIEEKLDIPMAESSVDHSEEEEEKLRLEELLQSLPKEKGWISQYMYLYQQFWCRSPVIQPTITFQKHFQAKHSDIVIATLPKAGTTWLKALAFATVKRSRFIPTSQNDSHPLLNSNPHTLVPFLHNTAMSDLSTLPEPRMIATHIPFPSLSCSIHNSNCKIIYICRNPFDTFISYWHFSNNILSSQLLPIITLEEAFEGYCEGIHPYGSFWSHILGYWNASKDKPSKVLFLKYEELKANTGFELKRMAQFLDCPFSEEEESGGVVDSIIELCSFKKMKELDINKSGKSASKIENKHFFRKGETGDWVNYFSPSMIEKLSKVIEEKLGGSGLTF